VDYSHYRKIVFRRDGKVLHATFNRPEVLNAFDAEMDQEVGRLFDDVARDDATNVLVLTGAGKAFSAGGDIEHMQTVIDNPQLFLDGLRNGKKLLFSMLDCPKTIIAKVNGAAMGLGATIALFSDLVYAARHAKIADPHVKVGYAAGDGGAVIWPALLGPARAKRYLLTGDVLTGEQAAAIGLVNEAVASEDLDRTVDEIAQRIATGASLAIQFTKMSVNVTLKQQLVSVIDASFAYEALSGRTADHQEAVNAFREKRAPRFTGK